MSMESKQIRIEKESTSEENTREGSTYACKERSNAEWNDETHKLSVRLRLPGELS